MDTRRCTILPKIPKIAYCYFGGDQFSFLRYASVQSFVTHNPDWRVVMFRPSSPSESKPWPGMEQRHGAVENCINLLRGVDIAAPSAHSDMPDVWRADLTRSTALATTGGVWFDTDILFVKPLTEYFGAIRQDTDTVICQCVENGVRFHSCGFLASGGNNAMFGKVLESSPVRGNSYQAFGPDVFNAFLPSVAENGYPGCFVHNLPMAAVYPIFYSDLSRLLQTGRVPRETFGIHWYGGNPFAGWLCEVITKGNWKSTPGILGDAIRRAGVDQ